VPRAGRPVAASSGATGSVGSLHARRAPRLDVVRDGAPSEGTFRVIRLQNVTKTYKRGREGEVRALDDVSMEIVKGEFVFVVGPSGSGKSTLMKLLTREQVADRGELWVAGKNLGSMRSWKVPNLRREIGYVYQDFKLLAGKTVYENVAFALEVIGRSRRDINARVPQTLELVGLEEKSGALPTELSGGQQQRVSIARAFVNSPRLLLCDEPTGNLDPATSVGIMKLLDRINRTGTTVLMATHDQQIVDSMRRRVIELEGGRIVRDQSRGVYGYGS
jgi:cell division transport system ATP-binding protein